MRPAADEVFEALNRGRSAGSAVRVERLSSGELLFVAAHGLRRTNGAPMQAEDRYHLASIGKTLTAVLVAQLAEQGRCGPQGLDTPLGALDVLPAGVIERLACVDGRSFGHAITLRQLLQHTSGLRDAMVDDRGQLGGPAPGSIIGALMAGSIDRSRPWLPWVPAQPGQRDAGVLNWHLHETAAAALHAPGRAFHYSDTGYVLLGLAVERLGGVPLPQALRQRIFDPLGLQRTYLAYHGDPPGLTSGREGESEPWLNGLPCLSEGVNLSFDWGGGGIVSTAAEQATFLRAVWQGRLLLSAASHAQMTDFITPEGLALPRSGVGLGLFREQHGALELIGHAGAWGSRMFAAPAHDLLVVGTLNRAPAVPDWHARVLQCLVESLE